MGVYNSEHTSQFSNQLPVMLNPFIMAAYALLDFSKQNGHSTAYCEPVLNSPWSRGITEQNPECACAPQKFW